MVKWAVLVVERDGAPHYVRQGEDDTGPIATWTSRRRAEAQAEFWRQGLGDEVQSVNVVRAPRTR